MCIDSGRLSSEYLLRSVQEAETGLKIKKQNMSKEPIEANK